MTFTKTLFCLSLLFYSFLLSAQNFHIEHYDVSIELNNDGSFDVTEKIDVDFAKKMRGIYRTIEIDRDLGEFTQRANISNIKTGKTNRKITKNEDGVEIRLGKADKYLIGPQTYVITYTVENAITPYEEHDEFYWSLMGNNWKEQIKSSTFKLALPNDINLSEKDIAVFTDKNSTAQHARVQFKDRVITGSSLSELGQGEGLTVAFKTPKGYFSGLDYSSILKTKKWTNQSRQRTQIAKKEYPRDWGFPIPAVLIGSFLLFFNRHGKNKQLAFLDSEIYYPPEDLNPPEIGVFHDFQVNKRDLISLIPYWGERGYLKVASLQKDDGSVDMRFEKQKELPSTSPAYETEFFNAIFKTGDSVYLHDLENEMYKSFNTVGKSLKSDVLDMKLYDQDSKQRFHSGKYLLYAGIAIAAAITGAIVFHAFASMVLFLILAIVCLFIHFHKPKKNERGLHLHNHLTALKQTLENPDPKSLNQIITNDPQYLDKIFPYVVAFGIDNTWSKNVTPIFNKAPEWYYGDDMTMRPDFNTFNRGFSTNSIGKTFTSSPVADSSSSAFGGSRGGGFSGSSGGGFGGGGGGGGW